MPTQDIKENSLLALCVRVDAVDSGFKTDYFYWAVHVPHLRDNNEFKLPKIYQSLCIYGPVCNGSFLKDGVVFDEYELALPYYVRAFSIKYGKAKVHFSYKVCSRVISDFYERVNNPVRDIHHEYPGWLEKHNTEISFHENAPEDYLFSIVVPLFNTPKRYLIDMIESVINQTYSSWELILVNASPNNAEMKQIIELYTDSRIIVTQCGNEGIASNTNKGISLAKGDYIGFLDHDDILSPFALNEYALVISRNSSQVDLLYCDEDSFDDSGNHFEPIFKPDWNFDLLCSNNYVIHFLMVSRFALEHTERSCAKYDGAQDYDLTFKAARVASQIVHVPEVLYHWRKHPGSINADINSKPYALEAGRLAIEDNLTAIGIDVSVETQEKIFSYKTIFKGNKSYRITASTDIYSWLSCEEDVIIYAQEGLEVTEKQAQVLAGYFEREDIFSVSPKIIRTDNLNHYANIAVEQNGELIFLDQLQHKNYGGYIQRANRSYDALVCSADCFAISRLKLSKLISEKLYLQPDCSYDSNQSNFNIVVQGLCQRAYQKHFLNVYCPYAVANLLNNYPMAHVSGDAGGVLCNNSYTIEGDMFLNFRNY